MNIKELVKTSMKEVVFEDKLNMFLKKMFQQINLSGRIINLKKKFDVYPIGI